ncbi:hypothetical protein ACHAXT_006012 [Thalassiosira profunda]
MLAGESKQNTTQGHKLAKPDPKDKPPAKEDAVSHNAPPESSQHEIGLSLQSGLLDKLKDLPPFPKIVHLIWNDKQILNSTFQMLEQGAKNLQRLNPDWEFRIHDFDDINDGIQTFEHPDIPLSAKKDLATAHIVEKTDAYRLMRIYETGGLYVDIDRVMNKKLDEYIDPLTTKLVIPTYYDINFAQDLFGSSPKNELILNVFIRQCAKRETYPRKNGWIKSSDHMTLVNTFSESLEEDLFGQRLARGNRTLNWNEARHILNSHTNGMVVTAKDEWCNGLLVEEYEGCKRVSRNDLYRAYNVTAWVPQVDAVWKAAEKRQ